MDILIKLMGVSHKHSNDGHNNKEWIFYSSYPKRKIFLSYQKKQKIERIGFCKA